MFTFYQTWKKSQGSDKQRKPEDTSPVEEQSVALNLAQSSGIMPSNKKIRNKSEWYRHDRQQNCTWPTACSRKGIILEPMFKKVCLSMRRPGQCLKRDEVCLKDARVYLHPFSSIPWPYIYHFSSFLSLELKSGLFLYGKCVFWGNYDDNTTYHIVIYGISSYIDV